MYYHGSSSNTNCRSRCANAIRCSSLSSNACVNNKRWMFFPFLAPEMTSPHNSSTPSSALQHSESINFSHPSSIDFRDAHSIKRKCFGTFPSRIFKTFSRTSLLVCVRNFTVVSFVRGSTCRAQIVEKYCGEEKSSQSIDGVASFSSSLASVAIVVVNLRALFFEESDFFSQKH
jgi:hypothetical protein